MSLPEVSESLSSDLRAIAMRRGGGRLGNLYVVNGKKAWTWLLCLVILFLAKTSESSQSEERTEPAPEDDGRRRLPIVISTWGFVEAVGAAWKVVDRGGSPVDAVVAGCSTCERLRCDGSGALAHWGQLVVGVQLDTVAVLTKMGRLHWMQ